MCVGGGCVGVVHARREKTQEVDYCVVRGGGTRAPSRAPSLMPSHCLPDTKCRLQWHW